MQTGNNSTADDTRLAAGEIPRSQSPSNMDTADLAQALLDNAGPSSPTSPHTAADGERAKKNMDTWTPVMDRRQSWSAQEWKHEQQKPMYSQTAAVPAPNHSSSTAGFTETR
ncbi:hypothetical protein B0T24DRAFT_674816 [Lasiosphaeria ovina]|uniref:Uncharacterized protein n=1 Tax=Lasiosphaeria ovina TaxID=92902 RepID=A0AAE0KMI7_9PEZI|nr:hypothetical protein B0T24DRAFT_674816 [Lasiosphaeria ovina]